MEIIFIWPSSVTHCLLQLGLGCDAGFIPVVKQPHNSDTLASKPKCLTPVRQKKKIASVGSILLQPCIYPSADSVCFNYTSTDNLFVNCVDYFHSLLNFEHSICERQDSSPGIRRLALCEALCYSCTSLFSLVCDFYLLWVKTSRQPPLFSGFYVFSVFLLFEMDLWAWSTWNHFLRGSVWVRGMCSGPNFANSSIELTHVLRVEGRISPGRPLSVSLPLPLLSLADAVDTSSIVYDFHYSLASAKMSWKTKKSTDWEIISFISQSCWLPFDFYQKVVGVFSQKRRICVANQGPDQSQNAFVLSAVPLLCSSPTWEASPRQAS